MSWQDEQPPWGQKKGPASPEDLVAALLKKIKDSFSDGGKGGGGSPGSPGSGGSAKPPIAGMALIALAIGLFIVAQSAFYQVDAGKGEKGIVLRMGKFHTLTEPVKSWGEPQRPGRGTTHRILVSLHSSTCAGTCSPPSIRHLQTPTHHPRPSGTENTRTCFRRDRDR